MPRLRQLVNIPLLIRQLPPRSLRVGLYVVNPRGKRETKNEAVRRKMERALIAEDAPLISADYFYGDENKP